MGIAFPAGTTQTTPERYPTERNDTMQIRRNLGLLALTFATGLAPTTGCFLLGGYDGAYIEREDVSLDIYGGNATRSSGEKGEVYMLVAETAYDVNSWVAEVVEATSAVTRYLNNYPAQEDQDGYRSYGPFDDEDGRDLAWIVKIKGDASATSYKILVGDRGEGESDMLVLLDGHVEVDGDMRTGGFRLFFDAIEDQPELKDLEDSGTTFSGTIDVSFTRDVSTEEKTVDIQFNDFRAEYTLGDAWYSDETYAYHRDAAGNGEFHLAVYGTFDDQVFGGYQTNKVVLDAKWDASEAGRARGQVLEVENEDSALPAGDLVVHECFDAAGDLTYRGLNDAYASDHPEYLLGDPSTCIYEASDLDG